MKVKANGVALAYETFGDPSDRRCTPKAELILIPGIAHDLRPFMLAQVANEIAKTAARAG